MLGVRPFTAATRPLLVIASGYSLVALWVMGHGDLWWGAAVDVVLFVVGLTGAYNRLPAPRPHGRLHHAAGVIAAVAFLAMPPAPPWMADYSSLVTSTAMPRCSSRTRRAAGQSTSPS